MNILNIKISTMSDCKQWRNRTIVDVGIITRRQSFDPKTLFAISRYIDRYITLTAYRSINRKHKAAHLIFPSMTKFKTCECTRVHLICYLPFSKVKLCHRINKRSIVSQFKAHQRCHLAIQAQFVLAIF